MIDPRSGLAPWQPSSNSKYDQIVSQGNYWPYGKNSMGPFSFSDKWPEQQVSAKPMLPISKTVSGDITYVKQAPRDTIVFDESLVSANQLIDLFFEDIGGLELANISRSDLIDGQQQSYSPIKNLSSLKRRFNPNNIIANFSSVNTYFSRFGIDLLKRNIFYPIIDEDTGDLIIEIESVFEDEEIEVQILSSGTIEKVAD
jgi:hypothetical protein